MVGLTQHRPEAWKYEPAAIAGQRMIVTGGTTGIGRTTALLLASLGAKVLIFGRHDHELRDAMQTMEEAECAQRVVGLVADVTRESDVDRVFLTADEQLGGLDVLINNASVPGQSITDTKPEEYRYIIETNLVGYMACAQRAIPRFRKQGSGTIINIGSLSAKSRGPGGDIYVAAKTALRGFCDSLAKHLHSHNIRVTLIEPGNVGSDLNPAPPEEEREQEMQGTMLTSEAIAEAVLYCLAQPMFVHIPLLQIQPLHQDGDM